MPKFGDEEVNHVAIVAAIGNTSLLPMLLVPSLKLAYLTWTLNLDIEFDILRKARFCEITGANKRFRSDNFQFRMGYVSLSVKF